MKIIYQWMFWVLLMKSKVNVFGEFFIVSGPQYNTGYVFYKNQQSKTMFCVTDDTTSALTWNNNLEWKYENFKDLDLVKITQPYVIYNNTPMKDNLTCRLSSSCSGNWQTIGKWYYVSSLLAPMSPVFDSRWEDFKELQMTTSFQSITTLPITGSLGISIRGFTDGHLAICSSDKQNFCFYIILGGWNNTRSVIRKCDMGIPEPADRVPEGQCRQILVSTDAVVLSSVEWRTFVINWDFRKNCLLRVYNSSAKLLEYSEPDLGDKFVGQHNSRKLDNINLLARSRKAMLMKLHDYKFIFTRTTQSKLISPEVMAGSPTKNICMQMSISLCDKCMITIDFHGRNNQTQAAETIQSKGYRNVYNLPHWRDVTINKTLSADMEQPVEIVINTFSLDKTNRNNFWALSNVRRCHDGALKVTKIVIAQDYLEKYEFPKVTCQKVSSENVSLVIDSAKDTATTIKPDKRKVCTEGNIGPSCSLTCSKLFDSNKDCHKLLACDQFGCSCAQGFYMSSCDTYCQNLTYGHDCQNKCGDCLNNSCSPTTGLCIDGCNDTDTIYHIPPFCEIGLESPPSPTVEVINSTFARIFLNIKKEYKLIPTKLSFMIQTNNSYTLESEPKPITSNTDIIEVLEEHLTPGTEYKVVSILHTANKSLRGDEGHFTTFCTESAPSNFKTHVIDNNITIEHWIDVHINDSCPYTWYRVQLYLENVKVFDNTTSFPKTFQQLEFYTKYRIVVLSKNSTVVNKYIRTSEGAPSPVENVEIITEVNSTSVSWSRPKKSRGKLLNYTIELQLIESLGCLDLNRTIHDSSTRIPETVVIRNTSHDSYNYTFTKLNPYSIYQIVIYASTSKSRGDHVELSFATNATAIPTQLFTNFRLINETSKDVAGILRWNPPFNCSLITGPIKGSKLYVKNSSSLLVSLTTDNYYYELSTRTFHGDETYEARVYPTTSTTAINETAYTTLIFVTPPRPPPTIPHAEIVETNSLNNSLTLRWRSPIPPLNGKLELYIIRYYSTELKSCAHEYYTVNVDEYCTLWNLNSTICKTIPWSNETYDRIEITALNANVSEPSEPFLLPTIRNELKPSAPMNMSYEIIDKEGITIDLAWNHPLITGNLINKFTIEVEMLNTNLKDTSSTSERYKTIEYSVHRYERRYNKQIKILPSSTFSISVQGVTWNNVVGPTTQITLTTPNDLKLNSTSLETIVNDDLTISIRIPSIINDIQGSVMVIVMEGFKFCGQLGGSNNENIHQFLTNRRSSYYTQAWRAATLNNPESYAGKLFKIGDGEVYGGSKNYALCPQESYVAHLIIADKIILMSNFTSINIFETVESDKIYVVENSKNYTAWLMPTFLLVLIVLITAYLVYRRKLTHRPFTSESKNNQQENMPLSSELGKKKSNDLMKDNVPNNNLIVIDKEMNFLMPVETANFEKYFEYAYKSGVLDKEYSILKQSEIKPHTYGALPETKTKNRYANLIPFDETRVILEKLPDDPFSDYINANFITGYKGRKNYYIATQGPKPNTVVDFWRMIWQEKVQLICNLANLIENGKVKCEQYWPSAVGKEKLYGKLLVKFSNEKVYSDYSVRSFRITSGNSEPRVMQQLHYTSWPDHGVPLNPHSIVKFLKEIQSQLADLKKNEQSPIVVHCSAGVGRTGTLIVLDMSIRRILEEEVIDVYASVTSVRKERLNMVDNSDQYLLIHLVLIEYLNSSSVSFSCDKNLPKNISEAKKNSSVQFQRILETSWWNQILNNSSLLEKPLSNNNRAKHRFPECADSLNRLFLQRSVLTDEDSDYIAATCVKGVIKDRQYIATQLPLPSTFADFWRMISEKNVKLILVLELPNLQDTSYCELVPENQEFGAAKYLKVIRQLDGTENNPYYLKEQVLIINSSELQSHEHTVTIISYKNWPESSLPPPNELIELWNTFEKFSKNSSRPSVIVCRNGVTVSGLWLAISYLLKTMIVDEECNVTQAARTIQSCKKNFLTQLNYFEYLYDVALAWFNRDTTK